MSAVNELADGRTDGRNERAVFVSDFMGPDRLDCNYMTTGDSHVGRS